MTDRDAPSGFLDAIRAAPADDAPRLAYAEHLTRRGDARGEFIVVQCAVAKARKERASPEELALLEAREEELLDGSLEEWLTTAGIDMGQYSAVKFERGFIEHFPDVYGGLHGFSAASERSPIRSVSVRPKSTEALAEVLALPSLAGVDALHIWGDEQLPLAAVVARCGSLPRLTSLALNRCRVRDALPELLSSKILPRLEELKLFFDPLSDDEIEALIDRLPSNMTSLEVSGLVTEETLSRILPRMSRLRRLRIGIGNESLALVAQHDTPWIDLELDGEFDAVGLANLAQGRALGDLESLRLQPWREVVDTWEIGAGIMITDPASATWDKSPQDEEFCTALGAVLARLTSLERLEIEMAHLADRGAAAIAKLASPRLFHANLQMNEIGPRGIEALLAGGRLRHLRTLDFSHNPIGDSGARALAAAPLDELRTLSLEGCGIATEGAMALASSPSLGRLRSLDVRNNPGQRHPALVARFRGPLRS